MASASRDALTECKEMRKCARTYRAGADKCGAGAGQAREGSRRRVAHLAMTGPQRTTTGGSVRQQVRNLRRRVRKFKKNWATMGTQHPTIGTGSGDDG